MRLTDINLKNITSYDDPYGKVILIGLLENGPTGEPFSLNSPKNPTYYLGDNPTTRYALALIENGIDANNIIYYRLNGKNASFNYQLGNENIFQISSIGAHEKYNNIFITFSEEGLAIYSNYNEEQLTEGETNYRRTYRYDDYPYTSQLANAINADAVLGLIDVLAYEHKDIPTKELFPEGAFLLEGGYKEENYINPVVWDEELKESYYQMFYEKVLGKGFQGYTLSSIMDVHAEVILYPDINFDNFSKLAILSSHVAQQKTESQYGMCYSVFHTSPVPPSDINLNEQYIDGTDFLIKEAPILSQRTIQVEETDAIMASDIYKPYQRQEEYTQKLLNVINSDEQTYRNFQHLMVVIGHENEETVNPVYADIPLTLLILNSHPYDNISNKEIENYQQENFLTKDMLARLKNKGYIYTVPSIRKNFVFEYVQAMDLYVEEPILKNWTNRRTLKHFEYRLNEIFEEYLGGPINYMMPNQLRQELENLIKELMSEGRIKSGVIEHIEFFPLTHTIEIELSLVFYQEISQIKGSVEIKKDGWDIDLWRIAE